MVDEMFVRRVSRTGRRPRVAAGALSFLALLAPSVVVPSAGAATREHASYRTTALPAQTASVPGTASRTDGPPQGRGSKPAATIDLRTTKRFSLAALRWPSAATVTGRLRAQRPDGTWTAWSDLESGPQGDDGVVEEAGTPQAAAAAQRTAVIGKEGSTEPTWTGPSRRLQVQLTSPRPAGLRAAFVDVSGRIPPVASAAQTSDVAGIQPRSAWDPDNQCKPRTTPGLGSVQAVVVHHTVGTNDYTPAQVPAIILAICKFHRNSNGWNDIGYNELVDKYGGAWEGRAGGITNAVIGAQAQGFNSVTAGISMLGDFTDVLPSPAQIATVSRVAAWRLVVAGVPRTGTVTLTSAGGSLSRYAEGTTVTVPRVIGHRDLGLTACPGNTGYTILDGVRSTVAQASPILPVSLPAAPATPPAPITISISTRRRINVGEKTVVTGTAKQGAATLRSTAVALQVGAAGTWTTVKTVRTTATGTYRFARVFSRSWTLRVIRTDGDGGTSAAVPMVVVPRLTLTVPKRLTVGKHTILRGTIAPGRGPVTLSVERRTSTGRYIAGTVQHVKMAGRRLTATITPHSLTLYRFRLIYAGSDLAAAANSVYGFGRVTTTGASGGASITR